MVFTTLVVTETSNHITTERQGESSIAQLFQSGAIIMTRFTTAVFLNNICSVYKHRTGTGRWCGLLVNCLLSIVYMMCIAAYWILYGELGLVSCIDLFFDVSDGQFRCKINRTSSEVTASEDLSNHMPVRISLPFK